MSTVITVSTTTPPSTAQVLRTDRAAVGQTVADFDFDSADDVDLLRTSGAGVFVVRGGALELRSSATRSQRYPVAVMRTRIYSDTWRMRLTTRTPKGSSAGFSAVFAFSDRRNYAYVHVDRQRALSGLYVVRAGKQHRIAGVALRAKTAGSQVVEVQRTATKVKVYSVTGRGSDFVGGAAFARAAKLKDVAGGAPLSAGIGSWGTDVALKRLSITRPGGAPPPGAPGGMVDDPTALLPAPPGGRAVNVASSEALTAALAAARPGDVITMADGTYTSTGAQAALAIGGKRYYGTFVGEVSGTALMPIVLQGSRAAIIDGAPGADGTSTQYGVYLAGASYWRLRGFTVQNVAKGIVLDRTKQSVIELTDVHTIGQEAIHLRSFSTDNVVRGNLVRDTGRDNATYGEGVYVGSAKSNWATYSDGFPDASDRNQVLGNDIAATSAESMDIKEGTTGGVIRGNLLDGAAMTGSYADSWIDMKGNGWLVESNIGSNALQDGFQVHAALPGWGQGNTFRLNVGAVDGPGFGFWTQQGAVGNVIACNNVVSGAASGFSNTPCV